MFIGFVGFRAEASRLKGAAGCRNAAHARPVGKQKGVSRAEGICRGFAGL